MEKVGFRDNRYMVTCERQLTVGVDGGDDCDGRTRSFPLRRHFNLAGEQSGSSIAREWRRPGCRKARTRARNCDTPVSPRVSLKMLTQKPSFYVNQLEHEHQIHLRINDTPSIYLKVSYSKQMGFSKGKMCNPNKNPN
jgi:hypothetical protein